jgi:CheY-like chemotaxis protein
MEIKYRIMNKSKINRYITCIHEKNKDHNTQIAIKDALQTSRKANESKKEFLSHICHEIKTPINNISGITQIAMNSISDTDKVMNCLEKIHISSNHLLTLINNILDIVKIDSDKLILINEPFYIQKSITEFSSIISTMAEIKNIDYKLIIHPIIHDYLIGDILRITQILGNCLSNSIKFTPTGGLVTLEIREVEHSSKDSLFRFQVTDNGTGMDKDYINRIFEPFDQENPVIGTKYGGSGLGMSIVKTLLDLMGGTIQVNSKSGEGTTVTIDQLLKVVNIPASDTLEKSLPSKVVYDFTDMRVLVVEDNEINLEIVSEYLKSVNVHVETAVNGKTAIELFEASEEGYYNLILMDVHMPDISGYEASQLIRSSYHLDSSLITIIAMTADNFVDNFSCIQCGINYHISKPIDLNKLYSLLNAIWQQES